MRRPSRLALVLLLVPLAVRSAESLRNLTVDPPAVTLDGPTARFSLLVHGTTADGGLLDLTHAATYRSLHPETVTVNEVGILTPRGDGVAEVRVEAANLTRTVRVTVAGAGRPRDYHFENDLVPLLGRYGCNASGCHGKAEGQNGFKLSVFGFDPVADHAALTREARGRRVQPTAPEASLLLTKASGRVAHGGGTRIPPGSPEYETLRGWIAAGAPLGSPDAPRVTALRVEPAERILPARGRQQLRVMARWTNGRETDVTAHARFQSNNDVLANVDATGLVNAGDTPGDAAVMASFMGQVDVFRALVPRSERIAAYPALAESNFIDQLVHAKLRKLHLLPSEPADDATFLRRVHLDVLGTLPTPDETRRFLADRDPGRRAKLVDALLERPEFADFWALKWADLLRVDRQALGHKRAQAFHGWLRDQMAQNRRLDAVVRDLLTAEGPLAEVAPAAFYKAVPKPGEAASTISQVFLGVRIACAECHHHPFDRWGQPDYYGMLAFFAPLSLRGGPGGEALTAAGNPESRVPRTGELVLPRGLGATGQKPEPGDRRPALAAWLTAPDNPWFARNLANRTWAHFLGRGLVEPVDDVRATNPPTNPELLDALARHLIERKFDFRDLVRAITASRTYSLSSRPNATNERDEQNYSRALLKRPAAEVLLDMVCQTTGVPERFGGAAPGTRAIQLWDSKVSHYFLKLFGRPVRATACECERGGEPGVAQVLHLLNSPEVHAKLTHEAGIVANLVRATADDGALTEEMYLTFYSRRPTAEERTQAAAYLGRDPAKRRQAAEDLAWSLLNSLEFVFNH